MFETYADLFALAHPDQFYIGGKWVEPKGTGRLEVIFPGTEKTIATPPEASTEDVDLAVAAARDAFENGPWPRMSHTERGHKLLEAAEILKRRAADFTNSWTGEMGAAVSLTGPGGYGPFHTFSYYAKMVLGRTFEDVRPRREAFGIVVKEPVGVVGVITPWNAPAGLSCKCLGPALAAGCTVVLKPSPETPLFAWLLAECFEEAGLPPGVFNFVPAGREVAESLVRNRGVDKIAFIGSAAAGRRIGAICGERLARCSLELGGKSPAIVLEDMEPDQVMASLIPHFTKVSGQMCAGLTRIIVPEKRHDEWADAIASALQQLKVGDPFDPATNFGPIAMKRQYEKVMGYIETGKAEGADLVTGGGRPRDLNLGYYVEPTLFSGNNDMVIAREEIFGPVAILIKHRGEQDAIRIGNDTNYGLNGAVYTNDAEAAYRVCRAIRSGTMTQNDWVNDIAFPFGGFKDSGIGRDGGPEGLALFQETKSIFMPALPLSLQPVA